ncbi:hypothetical protein BKA63DRAFT_560811 [Paraphoma chrysanthemicola]|nr:hypothetical protein BKA63DRAFT_560811 [Paraphoma chrysanthemicola]
MSSQQDTTEEALLALHKKTSANLAAKLERVRLPRHIVRDLSIDDIYSGASSLHIPLVPADVRLPCIFSNHNALYANRRILPRPTTPAQLQLIRAQWFWGFDRRHQFCAANLGSLEKNDSQHRYPSTQDLELVDWEDELVKDVLVDIDEDLEPRSGRPGSQTSSKMPWMDVKTAMSLFSGNYEKIGLQLGDEQEAEQELEHEEGFIQM